MEDRDLVVTNEDRSVLPAISDDTLVIVAEQAEKRVEAMAKIKRMALKLTNPHDWVDEQGRPYLQASGAEKVARLFGISWRISEPVREALDGGHYGFTYKGEFSLGGATIEAIGTRSSKDGFFKKYKYVGDGDHKERIELPVSEIDPGDVKKSAYTNLLGNGITRLLGIRNLTYEDLHEFAGISKDQVTTVEYRKGGKSQPQGDKKPSTQGNKPIINDPDAPATEAQCTAIHAVLNGRLKITDELAKHEKVSKLIDSPVVITSMSKLTKIQASTVIQKLQEEINGGEA